MGDETLSTVVMWVLIVFLAGFIGQFGKSLTQALLRKLRGEKKELSQEFRGAGKKTRAKMEKKILKARVKAEKKKR